MKIVYLAAGAAGMYCGSCLHDNTLAAALIRSGDDVLLVPTYTPIRTDERDVSTERIFFGGINVYLQQKLSLFRHTPWWLDSLLDRPALLARLADRGPSIDPTKLGGLTVSMLQGEHGRQSKELDKLCHWLAEEVRPDVVHLSNSLLSGMAHSLRERLGVPLVCTLSGEDAFVEKLTSPHYDQARALLKECCGQIDAFVALNHYYADFMSDYLAVDRSRIHVIPHGLQLEGHGTRESRGEKPGVTIGFLARICHDKGLHLLAEAVEILAGRDDLPPVRLKVAGYLGKADWSYLAEIEDRIERAGLADRYEYVGELNRVEKIAFLQSLDVLSVPTVYRESKGLPALEALANAVPVVLPDHGSFSEIVADTGGGLLCRPHDPQSLADKLAELILDPSLADACGKRGQKRVQQRYRDDQMADETRQLYQRLAAKTAHG